MNTELATSHFFYVDARSRRRRPLPANESLTLARKDDNRNCIDIGLSSPLEVHALAGVIFVEREGKPQATFGQYRIVATGGVLSWVGDQAWSAYSPSLELVEAATSHPSYAQALERTQLRVSREESLPSALSAQALQSGVVSDFDRVVLETACTELSSVWGASLDIRMQEDRELFLATLWSLWGHICRFGILTRLLMSPDITEIMAIEPGRIYVERAGFVAGIGLRFSSAQEMFAIIERIVALAGRRIDESRPWCDARLPDGSRVHAIVPPLALNGPCLTIRKFVRERMGAADLVDRGSATREMMNMLESLVSRRRNILISGGTGTGKTTLLNALSSFVSEDERIVTIEDSAELQLCQRHVVRLEARPANTEGCGEVTLRELLKNALRMRPDRIIVGECRGGEALDMLQAMNTGHEGSMTTVHANSAPDALKRLETLVMFASSGLPLPAVREQIGASVHAVVQLTRKRGRRYVSCIEEVRGLCPSTGAYVTECVATWSPPEQGNLP